MENTFNVIDTKKRYRIKIFDSNNPELPLEYTDVVIYDLTPCMVHFTSYGKVCINGMYEERQTEEHLYCSPTLYYSIHRVL